MINNDTWKIVKRPVSKNVIGCRMVLTNKFDANGVLARRKARLVAKGYSQKPGSDFKETFAPVSRLSSMRLITALAVKHNLRLYQLDIETAFLNGEIEEEIYMEKPDFLHEMLVLIAKTEDNNSPIVLKAKEMLSKLKCKDTVCCLQKAIYGLRQAGRQWHLKLDNKLRKLGLLPTNADACIYRARKGGKIMIIMTYVDDILIASDDQKWTENIKGELMRDFKVRDLGLANYCLGIQIEQKQGEIKLSQEKYIKEVLNQIRYE